jgi:hypothetical protein
MTSSHRSTPIAPLQRPHPRTQVKNKIQTEEFRISYGTSRSISIPLSQSVEWRSIPSKAKTICKHVDNGRWLAVVLVRTVNRDTFDMYTLYMCEIHHNEFSFHEVRIKLPVPIAAILAILRSPRPLLGLGLTCNIGSRSASSRFPNAHGR